MGAMPTWAAILIGVCGCTGIFNVIVAVLQRRRKSKIKKRERRTFRNVSPNRRTRHLGIDAVYANIS